MNKEYEPMMCPVCNDFYFSKLQEGDNYQKFRCSRCGWRYDIKQANDPDLKNGKNVMSLKEYRKWYAEKIAVNPEYDFFDENKPKSEPHKCPICNKFEFKKKWSYDICPYCGWEDDGSEEEGDIGVNGIDFIEYKKQYEKKVEDEPNYKWKKSIK